jgi:hypothetical protein
MMRKAQVIAELENLVFDRLFVGPWYATDRATNDAIHEKFIALGLIEEADGGLGSSYHTPLGNELNVQLFEVFVGHWDAWEVPMILEDFCLIEKAESEALFDRLAQAEERHAPLENAAVEAILLPHVRRAYFKYRQATKLH